MLYLRQKENELIVIDEPELSLHPQLQARLLDEILELTKSMQVVISTHSSSMTSIESAINKGVIARVYENNGGSVISCIDDTCRGYFKSYNSNIYNPHIIGSDARSCFFAEDGFIVTEGQEDVVLFPKNFRTVRFTKQSAIFWLWSRWRELYFTNCIYSEVSWIFSYWCYF